jgi:hypothetical protein
MTQTHDFVDEEVQLIDSVRNFMAKPEFWRDAVGSSPKFFLHLRDGDSDLFGLSKFCAFRDLDLADYVAGVRGETDGGTTQQHISRTCGRNWVPLPECPNRTEQAFRAWFSGFFPGKYDLNGRISIIELKPAAAKRRRGSKRELSPDELAARLQNQIRIGAVGEIIALRHEVSRLTSHGVKNTARWIEQVSLRNVAAGYDIFSGSKPAGLRYIEVKASTSDPSGFYITRNELQTLEKLGDAAYLYLVKVISIETEEGHVVREIRNPATVLREDGALVAELFSARV